MFVITAEEAKKHVEPPRLATLVVSPAQATVEPGKKQTFTAKGLDQHGRDIDAGQVAWTAHGRDDRRGRRVPGRAGRGQLPGDGDGRRRPGHGERDRRQAGRAPAAGDKPPSRRSRPACRGRARCRPRSG